MSEDDNAKIDYENLLDPKYERTATDGEIVHLPSDLRKALNVTQNLEEGKTLKILFNTKDERVDENELVATFKFVGDDVDTEEEDGE